VQYPAGTCYSIRFFLLNLCSYKKNFPKEKLEQKNELRYLFTSWFWCCDLSSFFPVRADYQLNGLSKQAIDEENNANLLPIVSTCIPEWSVISDFVRFPGFKLCVTTIPLKLEFGLGELFLFCFEPFCPLSS
jgi:hypothetical protein